MNILPLSANYSLTIAFYELVMNIPMKLWLYVQQTPNNWQRNISEWYGWTIQVDQSQADNFTKQRQAK